ncbi:MULTISPECIES: DUF2225 domain-containing protein [Brevibacillus]|jgi:Uncharacterized protein conserved in bacteria|uniref:DUF2225 domain-containing protein n=1 Tax=Brevibacillus TaxID=55080 RepID=UPI00156B6100|nr:MULTISPECIES: DUF2225 domain-containing protein [Brevibacillus]MBU8713052.1 DUF2225 domain-containing protein [Brevibacillus parabrevis]MDH6348574.1 uncharacterized protein (DUF2225 family) [Brevibacillus sp. 1238]MDR5002279.1 DUF2225 domain-containing protein [Brevibacillus parabrevis]MED1723340.1 DUF2225 domain-containing protein [Brevibacillus parabrevis]NRQ53080.1 DUF2225 domain-containing protein [Brevibacillus sp. HD1.4A]
MIDKVSALYDKTNVCRHCEAAFSTKRVRSGTLTMIHRDSDFYTTFKEQSLNPILYTVNVCPTCGFAFTDQFTTKLAPWQKQAVAEHISSKWQTKDFGSIRKVPEAIVSYKLAIYAAELTDQPHSVKAGLYLRLAWLYRYQDNLPEELRFIAMAVDEYEESYIHSDYTRGDKDMSEVRLLYLIGELYRRLEKFDLAIKYFGKALAFRNHTIESGIIRMAQDQWQLAREEFKEKKSEQKIG